MKNIIKTNLIRIFLLVLIFLGVFYLYGCNSKNDYGLDPKKPVTVTIWHYYNGPLKIAFDKLISEFNETIGKQKGIIVDASSHGSIDELCSKVKDSVNEKVGAPEMPNIFSSYTDTIRELNELGIISSFDNYISDNELNEYVSSYIDEGRIDDENILKLFPIAKSTEILMLNKTDWDKFAESTNADISKLSTWEGITEISELYYNYTDSLTQIQNDGKPFFGRDAMANYILVGSKQLGNEIFNVKVGNVESLDINEDVMKKLWDNFYVPYIKGYFYSYGRFRSDDAKTGDIIALVCSTSGTIYFPNEVTINDNESYAIEALTLPLPNFEGYEPYAVQQGAGMALIKSDPLHEHASVEFLKWFTNSERNIEFSLVSGYLPVKKEAIEIETANLKNNKYAISSKALINSMPISLSQIKDYNLYTAKSFDKSSEAREILEVSLSDKAKEDKLHIDNLIKNGLSREEAISKYNTHENFNSWLISLKSSLEYILK